MLVLSQPPPVHDPEEVKQAADEVLSRAEFGEAPLTLLERIARWIADLFGDGSPSSDTTTAPGSGGSGLLTMVLLLLIVVGLALVIRALLRQPSRRKTDADPEPTIEVTEHLSASAWEREAAAHEADGRWKDVLRCRFRALLEQLVEHRVIDEVPGRTTGELRAEVADRAPGRPRRLHRGRRPLRRRLVRRHRHRRRGRAPARRARRAGAGRHRARTGGRGRAPGGDQP